MPKEFEAFNQLVNNYYPVEGQGATTSRDAIIQSQVLSDLQYGAPKERVSPPSLSTTSAFTTAESISKLLDFPGVTNSTESFAGAFGLFSDIARKEGKKLITQNLSNQLAALESEGINDQNIETYNNIWKEIDGYSKKAIQFQNQLKEEIYSTNNIFSQMFRDDKTSLLPPTSRAEERQKFVEINTVRDETIEPLVNSLTRKFNELKAPYLGQKFLEQFVGVNYGDEFNMKNYAARFNQMFNKDGSWKTDDPMYNAMKQFAYKNANPGDQIYMLQEKDVNNLIQNKDLSESERVTSKLLEDITLNAVATTISQAARKAADAGDRESLDVFKTTINNINDRVIKSKKDYGIVDYNKTERAFNQFGLQFGRATRSLGDKVLFGLYDYEPDAAHLGNDIRFGPVPVDINNDGKLDTDKYGNLIMSNQFSYAKADGSLGTNFGAIPELSAAVIGQMAPILAIDYLTRKGGSALMTAGKAAGGAGFVGTIGSAVGSTSKYWEAANAWKGLRIADRAATFGMVTGSVYDSMYADELRWTKDRDKAATRAWGRSMIEGLTEAIGAPEIGMFGVGRFPTTAKEGLIRMFSPTGATTTQKLGNFLLQGGKVGVLAGKQTFTESLEEEMSLYGNYLYGKMIKASDAGYEKKDEFQTEDAVQTFLDSFVGMAPYSLLGVSIQQAKARKSSGIEHQVLWDMANNPDYYRAQVKDLVDKKKFTPEQAAKAMQTISETKQVLESIPNWENLKDIRTLLSDKDAQMQYFHQQLYRNKLVSINYDDLNDEQKDALKNANLLSITKDGAQIQLDRLAKKETLTPEEEEYKAKLQGLLKVSDLSTHQFTAKEKQKLIDLKVLKEEDLTNSKEDLLKELESVDKSILKKQKRIEQFLNMSEAEKEKTITKLFDTQVTSVAEVNDPFVLNDILAKTRKQLNFVETYPSKYKAEQVGRQRLLAALEEKLGDQIAINPQTGRNTFTENLLQEDTSTLSLLTLEKKLNTLENNKEFVNEDDYKALESSYQQNKVKQILAFNELSPEKQEEFLVTYLKEAKDINPDLLFELETLKDTLSLKRPVRDADGNVESYETAFTPEISQELFDKVRDQVYEKTAEEKKQKPEDLAVTEVSEPGEIDNTPFTGEDAAVLSRKEKVDESGKSTDKSDFEPMFNRLNKTKDGKSTLSKEYFAEKIVAKTAAWLRENGSPLSKEDFNRVAFFIKNVINGKYNSARIASESREIIANLPTELQGPMRAIFGLAKFANKYYQVNVRRGKAKEAKEGAERTQPEGAETAEEEETEEAALLRQANAESVKQEKELVERQNAVIQLQTPSSTYGFEVTSSNKLSEDPAIQRNADILRFLTTQDYGTYKVRITSRSNFLTQLAESQGLNYDDFIALLNKAHEEYTAAKGTREQKVQKILPTLIELNNFFGEDFFEQTFDESRGIPELIYMVEKNGENLSDPILTIVNAEQAIQSFNGYPFYTNIDSNPKILTKQETGQLPYWENILGERVSELEQFKPVAEGVVNLVAKIKANPTHSEDFSISRVTQGTYITATQRLVPLEKSELEITEEDIQVLTTPKQTLGTEVIAGVPGQAFVLVNGVPAVLFNDKVDELEAEALAMMVFDKTLREEFFPGNDAAQEAEFLKKHISKVLNIFQKNGRKVAFTYDEKTQEMIAFVPGVSGKQLTQEELTNLFKQLFYNVDKKSLETSVPRFTTKEGEVVQTKKQSYLEFVKSTNKIYMSGDQVAVRRNQRIIFDMKIAPQPTQPTGKKLTLSPTKKTEEKPKGEAKKPGKFSVNFKTAPESETEAALEALEKKKGKADTAAENLKSAILANAKQAKLVEETLEDGTVDSYYLINGVRYERVSTEIPFNGDKTSFSVKRALKVGSAIDGILRDVFAGKTPARPTIISAAAFKDIVAQANIIYKALKDDYIVITDQMTVWNESAKIAGTMDMVLIDRETGNPIIVDFKTSAWFKQVKERIMTYNPQTKNIDLPLAVNPKEEYVSQQNSYGLMFLQQYGVFPELNIMYIQVNYADKSSENVTFASILTDQQSPIVDVPVDQTTVIPSLQPTLVSKPALQPEVKPSSPQGKVTKIGNVGDFEIFEGDDGTYDVHDPVEEGIIAQYVQTKEEAFEIAKEYDAKRKKSKGGKKQKPATEGPVSDKKADIEKRRQKNLEDTGDMFDYVSKEPRTDGRFNAFYITTKESAIFDTYQEAIDWVNSKYDEELAALETKPEIKPEPKKKEQKEEDYNPLAASLTPEQINQGKKNKEGCVGVGKKKKEV